MMHEQDDLPSRASKKGADAPESRPCDSVEHWPSQCTQLPGRRLSCGPQLPGQLRRQPGAESTAALWPLPVPSSAPSSIHECSIRQHICGSAGEWMLSPTDQDGLLASGERMRELLVFGCHLAIHCTPTGCTCNDNVQNCRVEYSKCNRCCMQITGKGTASLAWPPPYSAGSSIQAASNQPSVIKCTEGCLSSTTDSDGS